MDRSPFPKLVLDILERILSYSSTNTSFPIPQIGHTQSSGISSNAVPGAMPLSGSPSSGSYTHIHMVHIHISSLFLPPFR